MSPFLRHPVHVIKTDYHRIHTLSPVIIRTDFLALRQRQRLKSLRSHRFFLSDIIDIRVTEYFLAGKINQPSRLNHTER